MERILIFTLCLLLSACGKSFLEVKGTSNDVIPYRIEDYQALMDNAYKVMNTNSSHILGVLAGDEIQVDEAKLANFKPYHQRNAYLWRKDDLFEGDQSSDWNQGYRKIMYCNQVLDGLETIDPAKDQQEAWNNARGSALFFRAFTYYQLAQLFCEVYDPEHASTQLGLPLRQEADITVSVPRADLKATYNLILDDLAEAGKLLPLYGEIYERPSRTAVDALLARVYLQLADYDKARSAAENVLQEKSTLLDYNTLIPDPKSYDSFKSFSRNHPEVLFNMMMALAKIAAPIYAVNEAFYNLYEVDDLRKMVYFKDYVGYHAFQGTYTGMGLPFSGLATDEVYLTAAECEVRVGDLDKGLQGLNTLRAHRYRTGSDYVLHTEDRGEALEWILLERKKELVFRGIRWEDIRRLNREMKFPVILQKRMLDEVITIEPNDPRYTFPIPENVIDLGGIAQNTR